jgi:photosystem II stability/assembly factor-like uncharacterized protein
VVVGTAAVTFTTDDGGTLTPTAEALHGVGYTYGLVALDEPNTVLAEHAGTLLHSVDAGCTWRPIGTSPGSPLTLVAAPGGRAYGYTDNGATLVWVDAEAVTALASPTGTIHGLGVDPNDSGHLCLGGADGSLWESRDGGNSFLPSGTAPFSDPDPIVYRVAFDPGDLDHVVVGAARAGAVVSGDGGTTWMPSAGLSSTGGPANPFSVAISPADGTVIWVQGIDLAEADAGHPGEGRHIYRSTDGGLRFIPVVTQCGDVTLVNGATMAAHPRDPDVVYFVFGTSFQNYGTDLFRYDVAAGVVTKTHNDHDDVNAIAFSPADPAVLYLGLAVEERGEPARSVEGARAGRRATRQRPQSPGGSPPGLPGSCP